LDIGCLKETVLKHHETTRKGLLAGVRVLHSVTFYPEKKLIILEDPNQLERVVRLAKPKMYVFSGIAEQTDQEGNKRQAILSFGRKDGEHCACSQTFEVTEVEVKFDQIHWIKNVEGVPKIGTHRYIA